MANISANQWDPANFQIKPNHIMVVKPINGIAAITRPINKLMTWHEALNYAYSLSPKGDWKIPKIQELQTIFKIYGVNGLNNEITKPVWSSTTNSVNDPYALAFDFSTGKIVTPDTDKNDQLEVICIHY